MADGIDRDAPTADLPLLFQLLHPADSVLKFGEVLVRPGRMHQQHIHVVGLQALQAASERLPGPGCRKVLDPLPALISAVAVLGGDDHLLPLALDCLSDQFALCPAP